MEEVEAALLEHLQEHVFSAEAIDAYAAAIRGAIERQLPKRDADLAELEVELRAVEAVQKTLTKAVAIAADVPGPVTELRERATRARSLETRIAAIRRPPDESREMAANAEVLVRERLADVRSQLGDRSDLRRVFLRLFPEGIEFHPSRVGSQQVWKIAGGLNYRRLVEGDGVPVCNMESDPKGESSKLQPRFPLNLLLFEAEAGGYYLLIAA